MLEQALRHPLRIILVVAGLCLLSLIGYFGIRLIGGPKGIHVVAATYGGNCAAPLGNASDDVAYVCNGTSECTFVVDVNKLGDPASGCAKDFVVGYQCFPSRQRFDGRIPPEAGLGKQLTLSCRSSSAAPAR
jgi:hypothetical protein